MQYLNLAVRALQNIQTPSSRGGERRPAKRDSTGQTRETSGSFTIPFGSHLSPVLSQERSPERGWAVTAHQDSIQCVTGSRAHDYADGSLENSAEGHKELRSRTITTNDLLDCLVHPDVVARVTELLLDRQAGSDRTGTWRTHTHTHCWHEIDAINRDDWQLILSSTVNEHKWTVM